MIASILINASWFLTVTCFFCEAQSGPQARQPAPNWHPIAITSIVSNDLADRLLSNCQQMSEPEALKFHVKSLPGGRVVYINERDIPVTSTVIPPTVTSPDTRFREPTVVLNRKEGAFYVFNCGEFGHATYWVDKKSDESALVTKLPINDLVEFEGKIYFAYGHYNLQDPGGVGVIERRDGQWRLNTIFELPHESAEKLLFTKDKKLIVVLLAGLKLIENNKVQTVLYDAYIFTQDITSATLDENDNIILSGALFLRRLSKSSGYRERQYLLPGDVKLQDYIDAFPDQ